MPGEASGHDAVIAPLGQRLAASLIDSMDDAPEQAGHRLGPVLIVETGPALAFPQDMHGAEGGHGPRKGEIRPPVVVHGHAGRIPHHVAVTCAHADAAIHGHDGVHVFGGLYTWRTLSENGGNQDESDA